jgi:hypothetical protein
MHKFNEGQINRVKVISWSGGEEMTLNILTNTSMTFSKWGRTGEVV